MTENRETGAKKGRSARKPDPAAAKSFEESLSRLEQIVSSLESGDLGLDASLDLFEEGVRLSRFCQGKLTEVERKVELILKDASGGLRTVPLETPDLAPVANHPEGDDDDDGDDAPF